MKLYVIAVASACAGLGLFGLFAGYQRFMPVTDFDEHAVQARIDTAAAVPAPIPMAASAPVKIQPTTQMVYEYVYSDDGFIETAEETAPYFLLDADEERISMLFSDWEILQFSEDTVVMRKEMPGASIQHYIVSVQDGFVSVFYQQPINGSILKEITNTPVSTLHEDEQRRLLRGVPVSGEDELIRILQDYGS